MWLIVIAIIAGLAFTVYAVVAFVNKTPAELGVPARVWKAMGLAFFSIVGALGAWLSGMAAP